MATGKLSPRQKMINMMYLVLMALLALNVSKEILKTFHLMEVSFNRAKENLDDKIDVQMAAFRNQVENTQTLVPYYERALESDRITNEFVDYIEGIKTDLINKTGGRQELEEGNEGGELYEAELVATDNMEVHANYFMVDNRNGEQKAGWRGTELENRINTAREELLALLETDLDAGVKIERNDADAVRRACQLSAVLTEREASSHKSWSAKYLENSPLAGVITMLTKIQSDAKATQGAVLDVLYKGEVPNIPISQIVPIVRPLNGSVIMNGGTYEAEIVLAAQTKGNENDLYELKSGSGSLEKRGNSWFYKANSTNAGNHSFNGLVTVKTPTGDKIHDFNGNYQVFNGGATISATKMNVLYIGVDNDISVGVPGVNPRDVTVTMTGGSIRRVGSNYTAKCTERGTGKAIITATARMADGSTRQVGSQEYRIKKLPRPKAYFGAIETGSLVPAPAVSLPNRIVANLGRNFVFEGLDYKVVGYTFTITKRKQDPIIKRVNGDHISNDIKRALKNVKPGDRIIIDRIRAQGPSGLEKLDPILVEII